MHYELHYWPEIQGRGEFVRLALEEAGAAYVDVAREADGGMERTMALLEAGGEARMPFALPALRHGRRVIAQTALILAYLGARHDLVSKRPADRIWTQQLQLTIADLVAEVHDTHHPIAVGLYYADQKEPAARRAEAFRQERLPKFLGWFERVLERNPAGPGHLVGDRLSYADLSLFQVVVGLEYAFPKAAGRVLAACPRVAALARAVAGRPHIAAYLASPRRIPFNEEGIFRRYRELDG